MHQRPDERLSGLWSWPVRAEPTPRPFLLFVPIFYDDSASSLPATMPCINSTLIKPSFLVPPTLKTYREARTSSPKICRSVMASSNTA